MPDEVIGRSRIEILPKMEDFGRQVAGQVKQQISSVTNQVTRSVANSTAGAKKSIRDTSDTMVKSTTQAAKRARDEHGRYIKQVVDQNDKGNERVRKSSDRTSVAVGKSFGGLRASVAKSFTGIGGIVGGAIAGVAAVGFLKSAITAASDLGETTSKVSVIFGRQAMPALQSFAKGAVTTLGQSQQSALDAAATFGIFGKSAGLQGQELVGFSTRLVGLTSDMASFANTTPEEAITAVGAALRGESEPIRRYGVLLDDASVRQEALRLGIISTTKNALTPQQRVLAVQSLIFKQTKDAQGDFARTSGGLANQQRILSAQFANFKVSIGTIALPLVTKLFMFLNTTGVSALTAIRGSIYAFISAFKAGDHDITSSGMPGFFEQVGYYARVTFNFFKSDVVPVLKTTAQVITGTLIPGLIGTVKWFNDHRNVAIALAAVIGSLIVVTKAHAAAMAVSQAGGFTKWLTGYLMNIKLVAAATRVWAAVQWVLNSAFLANPITLVVLGIAALVAGVIIAYKHSERFRNIVNAVGNALKTALLATIGAVTAAFHAVSSAVSATIGFVQSHWKLIVSIIGGPFVALAILIATHWRAIRGAFTTGINAVVGFTKAVWSTLFVIITTPFRLIINFLRAVWSAIYPIIALPFFIAYRIIQANINLIRAVIGAIARWVSTTFRAGWALVTGFLVGPINAARNFISQRIANIRANFSAVVAWIGSTFRAGWNRITEFLVGPLNAARTFLAQRVANIRANFASVVTWVGTIFRTGWNRLLGIITKPIGDARTAVGHILSSAKGGLQNIFSNAVTSIGKIWTRLQDLAKAPIRFVVNTVLNSGLIDAFNWVAGKFGAPTIGHIPLPRGFRTGGPVTGPGGPTSDMINARLSNGEFVEPVKAVKHYGSGLFEALRRRALPREMLPGFAGGGLFDKLKGAVGSAFNAGKNIVGGALDFIKDPVGYLKGKFEGPLGRLREIGNSPIAEIVKAVPKKLGGELLSRAKGLLDGLFGAGPGGGPQTGGAPINAGRRGAYGGVKPWVAAVGDMIRSMFGITNIGGVGGRPGPSDHPSGHALDFMVGRNKGLGDRVANYMMSQRDRFRLTYLIWYKRIASASHGWNWRPYTRYAGSSSPTLQHMDHIHASFRRNVPGFAGGSWNVPPGGGQVHGGEMVFPERLADDVRDLFGRGSGSSGGNTTIIKASFPNYVGDKNDLVRALDDLKRHGRI